jgi:hypothetical protein
MLYAPGLVLGSIEGVGFRFHVLRSQTRFSWYRARRVPFSSFALPDSFSTVPRALGPVLMFLPPGLVFGGTKGVRTYFLIFLFRTHFWPYRGRRLPFSCFALPDMFLAVRRASAPIFMFCTPELIFDGADGVGSR